MQPRSLSYRTDLALLRLGGSTVEDRGSYQVVRTPDNPTYWWGNFILLDRLPPPEQARHWLDCFASEFSAEGHIAIGVDVTDGHTADLAAFSGDGVEATEWAVMTATAVRLPRTVNVDTELRLLESDQDWEQSVELKIHGEDRPVEPTGYRAFAAAKVASNRRLVSAGHGAWFGAFVEGRLVSQLGLVAVGGELARFQYVETDPDFRRRGLAGTLVHRASTHGFEKLGATKLVMVADPGYFAINLYRSVGFEITEGRLQIERPSGIGD